MHADTWWRGSRTNVQTTRRGGVSPPGRSREELTQVDDARADVTGDEIGVVGFDVCRSHDRARQHALSEAWRKALDLRLDARQHVHCRTGWHMTIRPGGVLPCGRA